MMIRYLLFIYTCKVTVKNPPSAKVKFGKMKHESY